MPVRTHRGRAAAFRRLWGWPLRSYAHLVTTVLAVLAIAVGIGAASTALHPHRPPAPPRQPAAPPPAPARPAPAPPAPQPTPEQQPVDPTAMQTAVEFGTRWTQHPPGMPAEQYLAGLQPLVDPEYLLELSTVDPARVPDTRLVGPPVPIRATSDTAEVALPTDAQPLHLALARTPDGWRVHHQVEEGS